MRAVEITQPGGPEVLKIGTRPVPAAQARAKCSSRSPPPGVNRPDTMQRAGNYPVPPGASDIPGPRARRQRSSRWATACEDWRVGDTATALVQGGGYAEYCARARTAVPADPEGHERRRGGVAAGDLLHRVEQRLRPRAARRPASPFLVQGGSSGIGVTAIQMVQAFGNRVFATAGSAEKCEACVKLGAERAINYKTEDFAAVVKEATGGKRRQRDPRHGRRRLPRPRAEVRRRRRPHRDHRLPRRREGDGRYLSDILRRRLTVTGSALRPRPVEFKGAIAKNLREKVWPLIGVRQDQGGHPQDLPARRGLEGARADGVEHRTSARSC